MPSSNDNSNNDNAADPRRLEHSEHGALDIDPNSAPPLHPQAPPVPEAPTFAELGVRGEIVRALSDAGIERAFAIQELTLPLALRGEDIIGQARTGTGKTLGYGVPLLQRLDIPGTGRPQALVVVPTRELCLQVARDVTDAALHLGARTLASYGGRPYQPQIAALAAGVDVVVGTPGRLLDLAEQGHLVLDQIRTLVLDEADEMLDLGFLPDVERILGKVPEQRQTMLFSATMPGPVLTLARTFLRQPTHVRAEQSHEAAIPERTRQFVYRAHALDKIELLARALQASDRGLTMIFARTKRAAQKLADELAERSFAVAAVHGDLGQRSRESALRAFRSGKVNILVATDVAARGIDITGVTHVINLQCPDDENTYVHRIGRTGRAGRAGVAITLVDWEDEQRWKSINDGLGLGLPAPVETYSTSAHLYAELGIPAEATGRLSPSRHTREAVPDEAKPRRARRRARSGTDDPKPADGGNAVGESRPSGRRRRRTRGGVNVDSGESTTSSSTPESERSRRRRTRGGRIE